MLFNKTLKGIGAAGGVLAKPRVPTLCKALRCHTEDLGAMGRDDVFGCGLAKHKPRRE